MKLGAGVSLCVASLAFSSRADAQGTPYFVVTSDGSTYQGQLVENVVGQHVTIRLDSGEMRTFAAGDVKSQGNVGTPSIPTVDPSTLTQLLPPGTPGAPPVAYSGPDAVPVHITKANNGEGRLFMESGSGWEPVCTMPCSTTVDPKIDYRLHDSDPFRFPSGHPLDLVADSGGRPLFRALGWTSIGLALAAVPIGILAATGAFSNDATPHTSLEQQQQSSNMVVGMTILGVSAALLTAGVILCAIHPSSSLATTSGQRIVKLTTRGLAF
jgi:hypothetical protein